MLNFYRLKLFKNSSNFQLFFVTALLLDLSGVFAQDVSSSFVELVPSVVLSPKPKSVKIETIGHRELKYKKLLNAKTTLETSVVHTFDIKNREYFYEDPHYNELDTLVKLEEYRAHTATTNTTDLNVKYKCFSLKNYSFQNTIGVAKDEIVPKNIFA